MEITNTQLEVETKKLSHKYNKKDIELESVAQILRKCLDGLDQFCSPIKKEKKISH